MNKIEMIKETIGNKQLYVNELNLDRTVLVVVDMVNGFVNYGALSSPRVKAMVPNIISLKKSLDKITKVYFVDVHDENTIEFNAYPPHCVRGTNEELLIDELNLNDGILIEKNSTNGFHAPMFQKWLNENIANYDNFIITGCVTDICVLQFSLTLKTYFNQIEANKRVIVPSNCVDTYDYLSHDGDLMHLFGLYNMFINGIEVVSNIK